VRRRARAAAARATALAVVLALVGAAAFAGPGAAAAAGFAVRDMGGRVVALPAPPRRIVSLVPSATEIVFALGGEDRLAGVTDYCDFPPAARAKPRVGGMVDPSLETLVTLRPDLVIATSEGNRDETFQQLNRLGLPVFQVNASHLGEVMELIRRLAVLTGREAAAPALVDGLQSRIQAVRRAVAQRPRPRVLYVVWPEPLIVPGRDALVTELIAIAGGDSISATHADAYPRFSVEAAVARAPEIILLARHGAGAGPVGREKWERLASLPAIRAGRIHAVDGNFLHRYGPRVVDGLEQLARRIHPEAFR
jgi:iron complex transport system substrate-binding protein